MAAQVLYSNTALVGTGKKGELVAGQDGYFRDVVLGGFGIHNNAKQYYDLESAKRFFDQQNEFMNMVRNGHLRGEYGHPRRESGMSDKQWLGRIMEVREDRMSHHIREVKLVENAVIDPFTKKKATGVLAELKPCGPYGEALEQSLKNPHENVCFSIRSLTNDQILPNRWIKYMRRPVTWDFVFLGGIEGANKYNSPSLEHFEETAFSNKTVEEFLDEVSSGMISLENSTLDVDSLRKEFEAQHFGGNILKKKVGSTPKSMLW